MLLNPLNVTVTDRVAVSIGGGPQGAAGTWGQIAGTLSNQLDLQAALDLKFDLADVDTLATVDHVHGFITNDGKIGSTSGLPVQTGTGGVITTGSFGTGAGTFCAGDDSRFAEISQLAIALAVAL